MNEKRITLENIAGYDDEKQEARKIIDSIQNYAAIVAQGGRMTKGLILEGIPGVGKTLLAKAIATESGAMFYEFESEEGVDADSVVNSLRRIFKEAREHSPAIVFIDELDELVAHTRFQSDFSRKVLKILLTEMDGSKKYDGVLVIATTNHSEMLPEALLRSGRMDKRIEIEVPDFDARTAIFAYYLAVNPMFAKFEPETLASKTSGMVGADIENIVNEVLIRCIAESRSPTDEDFEEAINTVSFRGIYKKAKKSIEPSVLYHEIGHFLVGLTMRGECGSISIERIGSTQGHVSFALTENPPSLSKAEAQKQIAIALGGYAAETMFTDDVSAGVSDDIRKCSGIIESLLASGAYGLKYAIAASAKHRSVMGDAAASEQRMASYEEMEERLFDEALEIAKNAIEENKQLVKPLFEALQHRQKITKKDAEAIVAKYRQGGAQ